MTTMTTTPSSTATRVGALGAATALVAATLATLFAHEWREVFIVVSAIAVVTAFVYGYVVPRALRKESAGGTALGLAIPALLLIVPAFWSGLPLVLGVAGLVVGNAGRRAPSGSGKCIAGVVIGALAVLAYLATYASEGLAGKTGFLFS
jgi:hypothetical protein